MTSARARERLMERLRSQGIADPRVLKAMTKVPRHELMDEALATRAYDDTALPIGFGQTISQPLTVARMTETLLRDLQPRSVLEVGTGSGYQTAVLAELVPRVFTIERIEPLLRETRQRLRRLGYHYIQFRLGDGVAGWPEHAPFDAIVVTAAAPEVPDALIGQLAPGGRLVIPVGADGSQELRLIERSADDVTHQTLERANFVPLINGAIKLR
jgi:protein-L-isoaspartate(D-aspartate) O-methyltransferase